MKRIISLLLVIFCILGLSACGEKVGPQIKEQVIYDENNIKVTAKRLEYHFDISKLYLILSIKNGSSEDIIYQIREEEMNNRVVDMACSISVPKGKTVEDNISINLHSLELLNIPIEEIKNIKFNSHIYTDVENREDKVTYEEVPVVIETDSKVTDFTKVSEKGTTVYEDENVKINYVGVFKGGATYSSIEFYVVNKTETKVKVRAKEYNYDNGELKNSPDSVDLKSNYHGVLILDRLYTDGGIISNASFEIQIGDSIRDRVEYDIDIKDIELK